MLKWIEKHSVNCFICHELVDERNCIHGNNGEGNICPNCQKDYTLSEND